MEDVLDLYHQDYDPDHPVVCFDETSRQLVADKRPAIGAKPGRVERYDYEYKRNGTRNLLIGVNYYCRCASIILAGRPPVEDAVELPRSDSWGRRTPGWPSGGRSCQWQLQWP